MNEESTSQATSISTTISNNLVSGNYGGMLIAGTPGESIGVHDRRQPDRHRRRWHRGAGEQRVPGSNSTIVDNATVTGNVIAAYEIGVRLETGAADHTSAERRIPG